MVGRNLAGLLIVLSGAAAIAQADPLVPQAGNPHGDIALDCKLCHSEDSWAVTENNAFDHGETGFTLDGNHRQAKCRDCHRETVFANVGSQCADCHNDTHRGRLGPACSDCHTPRAWVDQARMRDEHSNTAVHMVGAHERVDCDACHTGAVSGDYIGTPTQCYGCHADVYAGTTEPNHRSAGFDTDCERCHGVFSATWGAGDFIHAQNFPLDGAHRRIECAACHSNGFAGTSTACEACHVDAFNGATNPNHSAANFLPTACASCHTTNSWQPSKYDHGTTGFVLDGGHRALDCGSCHSTGFAGTGNACVDCHQTNYDNTTNPNHATATFPTDCRVCHSTNGWTPADFDHGITGFPLDGAHTNLDCAACHSSGFAGTANQCVDCHRSSYDNTNSPSHAASGFPTNCRECHTTRAWQPSTWNHDDLFPINSGSHRGKWSSCTDCHTVQSDFSVFECTTCHGRTDTDGDHRQVSGYQYLSSACFSCHPRGR